jgi:hypothetical protein
MTDIDFDGKEIELHIEDTGSPSIHTKYILARWFYLMGEPYLSDVEYDKIEKQFKEMYPQDIHSQQPWSFDVCPVELLKRIGRTSLICNPVMGYFAESISSINSEYGLESLEGLRIKSRLSFKVDGWNTRVSYFNGHLVDIQTRGRSGTNLDIRNIRQLFPSKIPDKRKIAITGELSIPNSKWQQYKSITGNSDQRASVRTALARNDIEYLGFNGFNITIENNTEQFDTYEKLEEFGFNHPAFVWVSDYKQLQGAIKYMSLLNKGVDYLTDGLVLENSNMQIAIRLGAWQEYNMISYVTGYEESVGAYGNFLKILCHPVRNEGKIFSKISINNIASIIENNLQIGSPIAFNLRSAANVVIDITATKELQDKWYGRYDEYKKSLLTKEI